MKMKTEVEPSQEGGFEQKEQAESYYGKELGLKFLPTLITIARNKQLLLKSLAVGMVAGVVLAFVLPTRYIAHTSVLPPTQSSPISSILTSQLGGLGSLAAMGGLLGAKTPGDMYVSMLKSRTVEDAMIQRFDLMKEYKEKRLSDAREKFESRTNVILGVKDGILRISVEDASAARAAEMANAYVEEFKKLTNTLAITEASQRRVFFEHQVDESRVNLANAEEALKKTQQTTGIIQLDGQAKAMIESAASLRAQVAAKQVQISTMRSYAAEDNADLQLARQQLAALESQLSRLTGADQTASDLFVPKGRAPEAALEYMRRVRDVKYYETMFEKLSAQLEIAKIDEAKQGALIQVVDRAVVPDRRSFPPRVVVVILTMLLSFLGTLAWVSIRMKMHKKLQEDSEARDQVAQLKTYLRT